MPAFAVKSPAPNAVLISDRPRFLGGRSFRVCVATPSRGDRVAPPFRVASLHSATWQNAASVATAKTELPHRLFNSDISHRKKGWPSRLLRPDALCREARQALRERIAATRRSVKPAVTLRNPNLPSMLRLPVKRTTLHPRFRRDCCARFTYNCKRGIASAPDGAVPCYCAGLPATRVSVKLGNMCSKLFSSNISGE